MKRFWILIWALMSAVSYGCRQSDKEGVKLVGIIKQPVSGTPVTVEKLTGSGIETIDSFDFDDDGRFTAYVDVDEPSFVRLNFFDRQYVNLVLTGEEEEVKIEVDGDRATGLAKVTGSKDTDLLQRINEAQEKRKSDERLLNQEAIDARMNGDRNTFNAIVNQYKRVDASNRKKLKEEIWNAVPSLAAVYGVNYLQLEANLSFADSLVREFERELPGHSFTVSLKSRVRALKKLAVGSLAPDIRLPGPRGDTVSLSSLRGNYVLIDFWAAWCRPCRIENPNLVRLYKEYEHENFEIFGVSLDRTREAWLRAIEADGLIWKQVSDLQYFNSAAAREYQITAIPATYLIDPEGRILAKGLRGEALRERLEEIFG